MTRHRLDAISLLFGAVFLVVAVVFLDGTRRVTDLATTWLWGLPVAALGLAAILVGVGRLTSVAAERTVDTDRLGDDPPVGEDESS